MRVRCLIRTALLVVLLLGGARNLLAQAPASPGVSVTASKQGQEYRFAFEGGAFPYVLRLWQGPMGGHTYRGLGLRGPWWKGGSFVNNTWYQNGFLDLVINGKRLLGQQDVDQEYPNLFDRCEILESGKRALVQYVWERREATIRLRFLVRPDCRALLTEVLLEPKQALESLAVSAVSFPGGYTTKGGGDRRMKTAQREEKSTTTVEVDLVKENFFLLCDARLDLADPINRRVGGEATGCSGLYVLPDGFVSMKVSLTGYPIDLTLTAQPGATRLRFAFDELAKPNAEAFEIVQQAAPQVLEILREKTFSPETLTGYDSERARREVAALAANAKVPRALLPPLQDALDRALQAVAAYRAGGERPISTEENALAALRLYERRLRTAQRHTASALRVFEMRGLGYTNYRVAEAVRGFLPPGSEVDAGYLEITGQGRNLTPFPNTVEEMYRNDAVLMLDVDTAALAPQQLQLLREYVEDGGGLAVFGGFYSYGNSDLKNSLLADFLPLTVVKSPFDLRYAPEQVLAVGNRAAFLKTATWGASLVSPWYHELTPAKDAVVLIKAEPAPWLAVRRAGRGRVLACAGTLFGEAPEGKILFWDWSGWPAFVAEMFKWLAGK